MAQGRVDIILKAVDDYSGVLTGLNQGFELTKNVLGTITSASSMAFNAVKTGAEVAYKGVAEAVNLAVKGGNYRELYEQLSNIAGTFKVDADSIIADMDRITDNTISMTDSARIAAKGIAAGFSQDELETVFTFVKRRTESTGESFEGMSEQIINAMQKGRYATLADMGLIIEKGMDTADVFDELARATELYGQTSNSTATIIPALVNQIDKFWTKIGMGIDLSPSWGKALTSISNAAVQFVSALDIGAVTSFTEGLSKAFSGFIDRVDFDKVIASFNRMLQGLANAANSPIVQRLLDSIADNVSWLADQILDTDFSSGFDGMAESLRRALVPLGKVIQGVRELNEVTQFTDTVFDIIGETFRGAKDMFFLVVEDWIDRMERFGTWLGTKVGELPKMFESVGESVSKFLDESIFEVKRLLGYYKDDSTMDFDIGDSLKDYFKQGQSIAEQAVQPTSTTGVAEMLAQANWPAEFQALGDFMFNWVLSAASGSPVPMAITTAR